MRNIIVLGASGSIGTQTLDLLKYSDRYKLKAISLNSHIEILEKYLFYFDNLEYVAITDKKKAAEFSSLHPSYKVLTDEDATLKLLDIFKDQEVDIFNALSSLAGVKPTLKSIKDNHDIFLANKESLVIASSLVKELLMNSSSTIYPVDSEHVALNKLLNYLYAHNISKKQIKKLIITASGGALRDLKKEDLIKVTPEQCLRHPTWKMGEKITIDSATMVNKAYECIEASILFDFPLEMIEPLICRDSLIHAKVIYEDNGKLKEVLEYSPNDMKVAIAFSLSKGKLAVHKLNIEEEEKVKNTILYPLDKDFYKAYSFALDAYKNCGNSAMLLFDIVDRKAIDLFLKKKLSFLDMLSLLEYTSKVAREKLTLNNFDNMVEDSLSLGETIIRSKK